MAYQSWSVVFGEQPSAAKWNILGTNDSSFNDGTGIGASAITPEKLLAGTGTSWAWQTWAPTWTGITVGNGSTVAKYIKVGKTVFGFIRFTFGSTSDVTATITYTLPVTAAATFVSFDALGSAVFQDAGANIYLGQTYFLTTTTARIVAMLASGTYIVHHEWTTTTPFDTATGDTISATFRYEAA